MNNSVRVVLNRIGDRTAGQFLAKQKLDKKRAERQRIRRDFSKGLNLLKIFFGSQEWKDIKKLMKKFDIIGSVATYNYHTRDSHYSPAYRDGSSCDDPFFEEVFKGPCNEGCVRAEMRFDTNGLLFIRKRIEARFEGKPISMGKRINKVNEVVVGTEEATRNLSECLRYSGKYFTSCHGYYHCAMEILRIIRNQSADFAEQIIRGTYKR